MTDFDPSLGSDAAAGGARFARTAERYLDANRPQQAEEEARKGLAVEPDSAPLHMLLGVSLFHQDKLDDAMRALEETVARDAQWAAPLGLMGVLETNAGNHSRAEKLLLDALAIDPEAPELYVYYGQLLLKTGHLDKATKLAERALAIDADEAQAHRLLSLIHSERNETGAARAHSARSLAHEPDEDVAHIAEGVALLRSGHPFQAKRHLREALRIDPADADTEELWLEADKATRWIHLPMYYWSLAMERIPGAQFTVWIGFIALLTLGRRVEGAGSAILGIAYFYIGFCVYTWVAEPLVRGWVRLFPPRL